LVNNAADISVLFPNCKQRYMFPFGASAIHAKREFTCQSPPYAFNTKGRKMLDILSQVGTLNRPKLLVQAARFGLDDYVREQHLQRILRCEKLPRMTEALVRLMDRESEIHDIRIQEDASYRIARHVEVLIAIMGEARLLRALTPSL
jgi:hypothetical protein